MIGEKIFMISVIIPVYNTAGYLGRCIDSVLHSSYQDFELILVNDGSSDRSPEICREYCRRDSRIKLIEQEHQGVSVARNRGIEASHGEWIVFVDSDDLISADFFSLIMRKENQCYDLLIFDHILLKKRDRKKAYVDIADRALYTYTLLDEVRSLEDIRYVMSFGHDYEEKDKLQLIENLLYSRQLVKDGRTNLPSPCAKAYKKSVIERYSICFPVDIALGEDRLFNLEYFMSIQSFKYVQKAVYFVEIRQDSAMHRFYPDFLQKDSKFQKCLKDMLHRFDILYLVEKPYYNLVLFSIADVLIKGIFNPYSTRNYYEKYRLCQEIQKNKIYQEAMKHNNRLGTVPRRVLLFFYNIKCYGMVERICKISYTILEWMEKL